MRPKWLELRGSAEVHLIVDRSDSARGRNWVINSLQSWEGDSWKTSLGFARGFSDQHYLALSDLD